MVRSVATARGIRIKPGNELDHAGRRFRVLHILNDFETLEVQDVDTGECQRLSVQQLGKSERQDYTKSAAIDLSEPSEEAWNVARARAAVVQDLLAMPRRRRADVEAGAAKLGVEASALYRWIRKYRNTGKLAVLLPQQPNGGRGKSRLDAGVDRTIDIAIETVFLRGQQRTIQATVEEVRRLCRNSGLQCPHANTVRRRIKRIPEATRLRLRSHAKVASDTFDPRPGHFNDARRPLAIVQVDHTKVDIELVDEQHRLPIGRPWITLVFDVFTRMVLGFHLSLDPPGANGTGLALAHAILPKETWLAKRGLTKSWPCYGFPAMVHVDNAAEFHGEMLRRACEQYSIELDYRRVATPHYGAHIERCLGTLAKWIHELPGTTFSNPKHRGEYDSEASASLTLRELEYQLAGYITEIYHQKVHSAIKMSPLKRWEDAIRGSGDQPGMGLERPIDEERIRLDFMPLEERTIQNYGVQIDKINYYADVLRPYINETANGRKRMFIFRRDPGDISRIYFWDPELKHYSTIPYRDVTHPAISVWELREVRRRLEEEGRRDVDENAIFDAYERLREHRETAQRETKRIRRERARRVNRAAPPSLAPMASTEKVVIAFPKIIRPYEVEDV